VNLTWILVIAALIVALAIFLLRERVRGKAVPAAVKPGTPLPAFFAQDENGGVLNSEDLKGRPAVLLFVRGNWCPFCSKQVENLTRYYKEINESGARLVLITPKPLETTRRVAEFFAVDFEFWLDESLAIGRQLGLLHEAGVPKDYDKEYGRDTLWPTTLVVDGDGIIRHTELSRFIADRPDPRKILGIVRQL
jgi:peroxiredoxin